MSTTDPERPGTGTPVGAGWTPATGQAGEWSPGADGGADPQAPGGAAAVGDRLTDAGAPVAASTQDGSAVTPGAAAAGGGGASRRGGRSDRRTLAVVSAGLRTPSTSSMLAERLAAATVVALEERGLQVDVEVVELRRHAHDLTNMLLTGFPSAELGAAIETVTAADGLVAVTPIYSGSYTGLFKNFFDVLEDGALAGMPVLLGATAGTPRHSLATEHALRPLFTYLHAVVVPTAVFGATDDFGAVRGPRVTDDVPPIAVRIDRGARELAPLVAARPERRVADPFGEPTPFERLLAGGS